MGSGDDFERRLLDGPTAALIHFHTLWDKCTPPRIVHEDSDICTALAVLTAHFSLAETKDSGRQIPLVRPNNDIWGAVVASELPLLLEDIMAEQHFFSSCQASWTQSSDSKVIALTLWNVYI